MKDVLSSPKNKDLCYDLGFELDIARTSTVYTPGFGTTTSNTSNFSFPQPFHREPGTSQRRTSPSRNMHDEGITRPSASSIPAEVIPRTCTAGVGPPSRMLCSFVGLPTFWLHLVEDKQRRCTPALNAGVQRELRIREANIEVRPIAYR